MSFFALISLWCSCSPEQFKEQDVVRNYKVSGVDRKKTVGAMGHDLTVLPHQHPDQRPYGIAVLSSLREDQTVALLQELHQGLTGLGWLDPPEPDLMTAHTMVQAREYWHRQAAKSGQFILFSGESLGLMDGADTTAAKWWASLKTGAMEVDLVLLCGADAVRSYRYLEKHLGKPVFTYAPGPADVRFIAESFPPSRRLYPLNDQEPLLQDMLEFRKLRPDMEILIPGDFDPLEGLAFRRLLSGLQPVLGFQPTLADRDMLLGADPQGALYGQNEPAKARGFLVIKNLDAELSERVIQLSRDRHIPIFASSGITGSILDHAQVWRETRETPDQGRKMALRIVEALSGYEPSLPGLIKTRPLGFSYDAVGGWGLVKPAVLLLGQSYEGEE